ncbi:S41 family peptidase [Robertkochia flava]|uniref:S41 family peptidase n=1 Tax=Robertkochia flava TaxID=3447986 RepID=UPI001CCA787A|nr:S41 family peptidase [Robertkochia marina]
MIHGLRTLHIIMLLLFISCEEESTGSDSLEGAWHSVGYGLTLELHHDQYTFYDHSPAGCIMRQVGKRSAIHPFLELRSDTLTLKKGTSTYHFVKDLESPESCRNTRFIQPQTDIMLNFEYFAATVKDHYAYFALSPVSWEDIYLKAKTILKKEPTEVQLLRVMEDILNTLGDNHGYVEASEGVSELLREQRDTVTSGKEENEKIYGDFQVADRASDFFLEKEYTRNTTLMRWGTLRDSIGYLQIKAMWLFAELDIPDTLIKEIGHVDAYADIMNSIYEGNYIEKERQGVSILLDTVMADLKDTKALIMDIRFNGGGQDLVSLEILKRFNAEPRAVARKQARYGNTFTDLQTLMLPASENPYLHPVFLLTSRQSASAADFLTLASLELPQFIRMGTPTQGALSDALEKQLPNGWYFSLSNEKYFDMEGNCYQFTGVPPHITLQYDADRQTFFRHIMTHTQQDTENIIELIRNSRTW